MISVTNSVRTIRFYKANVKMGHVGVGCYIPKTIAKVGTCEYDVRKAILQTPRVKRDDSEAIMSFEEITPKEYRMIKKMNQKDPFFKCHNQEELRRYCPNINRYVIKKDKYRHKDRHRYKVYHRNEIRDLMIRDAESQIEEYERGDYL